MVDVRRRVCQPEEQADSSRLQCEQTGSCPTLLPFRERPSSPSSYLLFRYLLLLWLTYSASCAVKPGVLSLQRLKCAVSYQLSIVFHIYPLDVQSDALGVLNSSTSLLHSETVISLLLGDLLLPRG